MNDFTTEQQQEWEVLDQARHDLMSAAERFFGDAYGACLESVLIARDLPPFSELTVTQLREVLEVLQALDQFTATKGSEENLSW